MSEKEKIKQELDEMSPLLSKLKEKNASPFQVPANYFQSLQEEVMRQVAFEKVENPVIAEPQPNWLDRLGEQLQWLLQTRYAMAFATVIILIVAGILYVQPEPVTDSAQVAMSELSAEEITAYISTNIEDFETGLLVEAMGEEVDPNLLPTPELKEDELNEYLDEIIDEIDLEELEDLL